MPQTRDRSGAENADVLQPQRCPALRDPIPLGLEPTGLARGLHKPGHALRPRSLGFKQSC